MAELHSDEHFLRLSTSRDHPLIAQILKENLRKSGDCRASLAMT
jgi:hypothetical protein